MTKHIPIVAIVGRTNIGKSTLFNALAGKRIAVVEDSPGVTRDRNYALIERFGAPFTIVDTGGLIGEHGNPLKDAVRAQAEIAVKEADLIIGVFDAKHGPHPYDADVVEYLRRSGRPVIWVANKSEKKSWAEQAQELYALGIDDLTLVSAANNRGIDELAAKIAEVLDLKPASEEVDNSLAVGNERAPIRVAIVGRPNVGKSTLVNKLIGKERVVSSPLAGTTRDSIDVEVIREGQRYLLVDTAGLRRKTSVEDESAERFSNIRALSAIGDCDVAVLVVDAQDGYPTDQDIRIATLIHERGRGFIIAVNKWDVIEKDSKSVKDCENMVYASFNFAKYAPIIFLSVLTGKRCPKLLDMVNEVYASTKAKLEKTEIEEALYEAFRRNNPPVYHGRPIKCSGAEQVESSPPKILILVSNPRGITDTYERYLKSALREKFPLPGVDMQLVFTKKTRKAALAENLTGDDGDEDDQLDAI